MKIGNAALTAFALSFLASVETRRINPHSTAPIDALVPWNRIQTSEDGNLHICLMTHDRANERGGAYCLFAPPNS